MNNCNMCIKCKAPKCAIVKESGYAVNDEQINSVCSKSINVPYKIKYNKLTGKFSKCRK